MKIIEPKVEIITKFNSYHPYDSIEMAGRICYKSEHKIAPSGQASTRNFSGSRTAAQFVRNVQARGHNSVLEMADFHLIYSSLNPDNINDLMAVNTPFLRKTRLGVHYAMVSGSPLSIMQAAHRGNGLTALVDIWLWMARRYQIFNAPFRCDGDLVDLSDEFSCRDISGDVCDMLLFGHDIADHEHVKFLCKGGLNVEINQKILAKHWRMAARFIVNRAVSHELARHRPISMLQESQRYCNYSADKFSSEVTFIRPCFWPVNSEEYRTWKEAMSEAEYRYFHLLETSTPQAARTVLPNSCATELIVYATLEEWNHIFSLRTSKAADTSTREVMVRLYREARELYPSMINKIEG